jgi:hypothetical protein
MAKSRNKKFDPLIDALVGLTIFLISFIMALFDSYPKTMVTISLIVLIIIVAFAVKKLLEEYNVLFNRR